MRAPGTGSISALPSGRWRARLPGRRGRMLPARDTKEEAERDLEIARGLIAQGVRPSSEGTPIAAYGRAVLLRRAGEGYRNARRELSRWTTHVEPSPLGAEAIETVTRPAVLAFVRALSAARARKGKGHRTSRPRPLSRSVVIDVLRILRAVIKSAVIEGLRGDDPTVGVEVARDRGRTHDPWTWLTPGEVVRLIEVGRGGMVERDLGGLESRDERLKLSERITNQAESANQTSAQASVIVNGAVEHSRGKNRKTVRLVGDEDLDAAIVALFTGLREGELWTLHTRDVDLAAGRLVVRYGGREGARLSPTKGRRPRTLQLLAPALEALRRQIERRSSSPLVFPSASPTHPGAFRAAGRPPRCWQVWLTAAGLTPAGRNNPIPVTWHSLRHTFATLALAGRLPGVEGEGWRLERVSAYLGHTSIAVTQRYADVAALL